MALLYPILQYLQGQPIVAPQKRRTNLSNPNFYLQPSNLMEDPNQQQEIQQGPPRPTSEDFITGQLANMKGRAQPPKLEPGARVRSIDPSIADPNNFQGFYQRLQSIDQIGQEQLAAAQAQAQIARLRASQVVSNAMGGGGAATPVSSANVRVASVPSNPRANFQFAQNIAGNYGWGNSSELAAWYQLGMNESGWNNNAQNRTSTAYGIGQFLNSTWGGYGIPKTSDPALQVEAMARYIKARYGSPSRALAAWNSRSPHWY